MSKRTHIEIIDLSDDEVTEPKVQKTEEKTEEKTEPTLPWFVTVLNTLKAKYPPVEGKEYPYFTGSKPKLDSYDEFEAKYFTPLEEFILKQEKDTVSDPSVKAIETLKYAKNLLLTCEHSLSDDIQFGHILNDTGNAILAFGLLKPGELPEEFVEEIKDSAEENERSIVDEVGESICSLGSDSYVSDSVLEAVTPTYILIHDTKPGYAKEQAFSKYEDKETQQKYRRILKLPYKPNIWVDSCLALRGISDIISEQGLPVEAYTLLIDSVLNQFKV
jgi:hypothetical protein